MEESAAHLQNSIYGKNTQVQEALTEAIGFSEFCEEVGFRVSENAVGIPNAHLRRHSWYQTAIAIAVIIVGSPLAVAIGALAFYDGISLMTFVAAVLFYILYKNTRPVLLGVPNFDIDLGTRTIMRYGTGPFAGLGFWTKAIPIRDITEAHLEPRYTHFTTYITPRGRSTRANPTFMLVAMQDKRKIDLMEFGPGYGGVNLGGALLRLLLAMMECERTGQTDA